MYVPTCFCKSTFLFVFVFSRGQGEAERVMEYAEAEMLGVKMKTQNKWMKLPAEQKTNTGRDGDLKEVHKM